MGLDPQQPLAGGGALRYPFLESPDFQSGVQGWIIRIDGSAEFNNLTIRGTFNGTNFTLNSAGLFLYSGTPAPGNLIASITNNAGTDPYGNTYLGGINTYSGAGFVGLNVGNLITGLIASAVDAGIVGPIGAEGLTLISPFEPGTKPDSSSVDLLDGSLSATPQSAATFPRIRTYGTVWAAHPVIKATNNANTWTAETWQSPTYNANWAGTTTFGSLSGGMRTLQYRRDAEDNLWLNGCFTPSAGAGNSVFNLPAAYRPAVNGAFPVAFISSGGTAGNAWMYVSQAGNLNINSQLGSTTTTGTVYYVNGKIPLGNVG